MELLVGADPELFVRRRGTLDFVSGFGLIQGDKRKPFPVTDGAVQVDGMALEFNINPADNEDKFEYNIYSVLAQLENMVPDYEVVASPVAKFTEEYMSQQPFEALELGCDPDYNGWTVMENEKPDMDKPMRTASGHVHLGWGENIQDPDHFPMCGAVARQLDFYLGLPSLFYDDDKERREMYGKAGAFRSKSYGMEYRVLSNKWLSDRKLVRWVYRNTVQAFTDLMDGLDLSEKFGDIQGIINSSNKDEAKKIINDVQRMGGRLEVPNV